MSGTCKSVTGVILECSTTHGKHSKTHVIVKDKYSNNKVRVDFNGTYNKLEVGTNVEIKYLPNSLYGLSARITGVSTYNEK